MKKSFLIFLLLSIIPSFSFAQELIISGDSVGNSERWASIEIDIKDSRLWYEISSPLSFDEQLEGMIITGGLFGPWGLFGDGSKKRGIDYDKVICSHNKNQVRFIKFVGKYRNLQKNRDSDLLLFENGKLYWGAKESFRFKKNDKFIKGFEKVWKFFNRNSRGKIPNNASSSKTKPYTGNLFLSRKNELTIDDLMNKPLGIVCGVTKETTKEQFKGFVQSQLSKMECKIGKNDF